MKKCVISPISPPVLWSCPSSPWVPKGGSILWALQCVIILLLLALWLWHHYRTLQIYVCHVHCQQGLNVGSSGICQRNKSHCQGSRSRGMQATIFRECQSHPFEHLLVFTISDFCHLNIYYQPNFSSGQLLVILDSGERLDWRWYSLLKVIFVISF